jgi:hypothetical protein
LKISFLGFPRIVWRDSVAAAAVEGVSGQTQAPDDSERKRTLSEHHGDLNALQLSFPAVRSDEEREGGYGVVINAIVAGCDGCWRDRLADAGLGRVRRVAATLPTYQ